MVSPAEAISSSEAVDSEHTHTDLCLKKNLSSSLCTHHKYASLYFDRCAPMVSPAEAISSSDPVDSKHTYTHLCLKTNLSLFLCIFHKCTSLYIDRCAPIVSPAEAISSSDAVDRCLSATRASRFDSSAIRTSVSI